MLPLAEQDGADGQMHFVNQAGLQILPNSCDPTPQAHIALASRSLCLVQGSLDTLGYEPELRTSRHGKVLAPTLSWSPLLTFAESGT